MFLACSCQSWPIPRKRGINRLPFRILLRWRYSKPCTMLYMQCRQLLIFCMHFFRKHSMPYLRIQHIQCSKLHRVHELPCQRMFTPWILYLHLSSRNVFLDCTWLCSMHTKLIFCLGLRNMQSLPDKHLFSRSCWCMLSKHRLLLLAHRHRTVRNDTDHVCKLRERHRFFGNCIQLHQWKLSVQRFLRHTRNINILDILAVIWKLIYNSSWWREPLLSFMGWIPDNG